MLQNLDLTSSQRSSEPSMQSPLREFSNIAHFPTQVSPLERTFHEDSLTLSCLEMDVQFQAKYLT